MNRYQAYKQKALENPEIKEAFEEGLEQLRVSAEIAALREERGYSQQELAKRAKTTQTVISKLERGQNVNLKTLYKVLSALGASIELRVSKTN